MNPRNTSKTQSLCLHRHLMNQLLHQFGEMPIWLHQLRLGTHKPIRHLAHTSKEAILKDPRCLVHPVAKLRRELHHIAVIAAGGCNFRDHDMLLRMLLVHHLDVLDRRLGVGTVVVHTQEIRRVIRDTVHEIVDPLLTLGIARARWTDEFLTLVLSQWEHLVTPDLGRMLRRDARAFRFVEKQDDMLFGIFDVLPIAARELGFEVNHGSERGATFQFGRDPGVPVADGGHGTFEIDVIHGPRDALIAWSIGIGPVPEKTSFIHDHDD